MYKRFMTPVLIFLAIAAIVYAIYRSTGEKIILQETTRQTIYGEPQHGLVLGLCLFAGICVAGAVALLFDRRDVRYEERVNLSKRVP